MFQKSSSYKKLTSLEEKLTSSEELVAEFQSTLLEKERKIKQLEVKQCTALVN